MENNDMSDIFKNIEKIKNLSNLMGGGMGEGTAGASSPMDMMKTIETVKKLSTFMNMMNSKPKDEEPVVYESQARHEPNNTNGFKQGYNNVKSKTNEGTQSNRHNERFDNSINDNKDEEIIDNFAVLNKATPFTPVKEINVLNAAIPFLDKGYQKSLFMVIKLLEMSRISKMDTISMQSIAEPNKDSGLRKNEMLMAIRPYLDGNEQKDIDVILKALEMKDIMNFGKL